MENKQVTQLVNEIIESEDYEKAQEFLDQLYKQYLDFSNLSNRVLKALRLYLPHKNAKIGLGNFVVSLFNQHGTKLTAKEIQKVVTEEFEYSVTPKAVNDSLYFLVRNKQLTRFYDVRKKKNYYYKKSTTST